MNFKVKERFKIGLSDLDRDEKIEKERKIAIDDNHYRVRFDNEFIHLSDKLLVEKGEWV